MIKIQIAKVYTFSVIVRSEGMSAVTSTGTAILATTANISFSVMQELWCALHALHCSQLTVYSVTCYGQPVHVVDEVDVHQHGHGHPLPRRHMPRPGSELHLQPPVSLVHLPHEGRRAVVGWEPHLGGPLLEMLSWHGTATPSSVTFSEWIAEFQFDN